MERVDPAERRVHCRVFINMDIEVCHLPDEGQASAPSVISCRGKDVSGGGVSFYGQTRYRNESILRLRIPLADKEKVQSPESVKHLKVMGKVMWCRKNFDTNDYVTGVQFLNIYEQDFKILVDFVQANLDDGK